MATPEQIERYVRPTIRGERHECYAITEEDAGSDVDAIKATARRDGDEYVLNGDEVARDLATTLADYVFFQAELTERPNAGSTRCSSSTCPRPGVRVVRTPAYTHTIAPPPPDRGASRTCACRPRTGSASEGDGMAFAYEWFRYERLMIAARCCGAAERLIEEATAFAQQRIVGGQPISEPGGPVMLADIADRAVRAARL